MGSASSAEVTPLAGERRVAAVVLPQLLCELGRPTPVPAPAKASKSRATSSRPRRRSPTPKKPRTAEPPFGVVLLDDAAEASSSLLPTSVLAAVNAAAHAYGVRPGQTCAEATVLVAHLAVRGVERAAVATALGRVAEAALAFGATVAIEAPDTVWVDVTGSAPLFGSESTLAIELAATVRGLGHVARVALAGGPRLAQAFARWQPPGLAVERGVSVVPRARAAAAVGGLPLSALPLDAELAGWLTRLGVITVADLSRLPRASTAARLGEHASFVLDLAEGRDATPLTAYTVPAVPEEAAEWEEPVTGVEPLLFVLRGLAARLSARLAGRGEAAQRLSLRIAHDRSIARLSGVPEVTVLDFELASPLWREAELVRVVASRLERQRLGAPSLGLVLSAPAVIRAMGRQLDLSRVMAGVTADALGLESLPVLLAELTADLGKGRVGVLEPVDAHRLEAQTQLAPALPPERVTPRSGARPAKKKKARQLPLRRVRPVGFAPSAPTRVLLHPLRLDAPLRTGTTLRIEHRLYEIEAVRFAERLDAVEWWTGKSVARDYLWLALKSAGAHGGGGLEALCYVERDTGQRYLQALAD